MISSQKNHTTKESIRTSKKEKEEPTQGDNWDNKEKEPRETQREDHEPDTLGRLIEEWAGAEGENWNKITSPRGRSKRKNEPHKETEAAEQMELIAEEGEEEENA